MANNTGASRNRPPRRRRRRPEGVPLLLVIILLIMSLLMGGLGGFLVARRTDPHLHELQAARDKITELENTLTLIGYPVGDDVTPQQWLYDNTAGESALDALSGKEWGEDEDALWQDDTLLSGTLPQNIEPVVLAEYDGGTLLSTEVIDAYNDRLTDRIFDGEDPDAIAEDTLKEVLAERVADKIIEDRAKAEGLTELTEADLAEIDAEAARRYEAQLDDYIDFAMGGSADREAAARQLAEESGVTLEGVTEALKQEWWTHKFYDHVTADVTVDDAEVRSRYDALMETQREAYAKNPEAFEAAHLAGDVVIVWRPEGYRAVRDILIPFEGEASIEAARLYDRMEQGLAEADERARLDELFATLDAAAQKAQDRLTGGEAFSDLMDALGCSAALRQEPLRSEGYYISSSSYVLSAEYVEGAMMLEVPGQVSSPLRSAFGLHLVEYVSDIAPGEVPFDEVADAVRAEALQIKRDAHYEAQRQALLDAANVKYYPERLH